MERASAAYAWRPGGCHTPKMLEISKKLAKGRPYCKSWPNSINTKTITASSFHISKSMTSKTRYTSLKLHAIEYEIN